MSSISIIGTYPLLHLTHIGSPVNVCVLEEYTSQLATTVPYPLASVHELFAVYVTLPPVVSYIPKCNVLLVHSVSQLPFTNTYPLKHSTQPYFWLTLLYSTLAQLVKSWALNFLVLIYYLSKHICLSSAITSGMKFSSHYSHYIIAEVSTVPSILCLAH